MARMQARSDGGSNPLAHGYTGITSADAAAASDAGGEGSGTLEEAMFVFFVAIVLYISRTQKKMTKSELSVLKLLLSCTAFVSGYSVDRSS